MKVDRSPTTKRDTMENEKKTVARGAGTPGGTAALYARLSKKDEGNIRAQLDVLQEWAVRLGYDTTIEYSDRASGITPNRPKLDLLMKDVQSGEIDAVLVVRIDRIMRSVLNLLLVTETLTTYGTALRVHDQPIDTSTSMGRFFLVVLAALAEYERELIRDRTSAGLVRAKKEGRKGGGKFRTLPPGVLEKLVLAREKGTPWKKIAEDLGEPAATLRNHYAEYLRGLATIEDIVLAREKGTPWKKIAKDLGEPAATLRNRYKQYLRGRATNVPPDDTSKNHPKFGGAVNVRLPPAEEVVD